MKDIPIFTCPEGIATLILREIPTRQTAYVLLRSTFTATDALCREAEGFCRSAGAETVCFGGAGDFSAFTPCVQVLRRSVARAALPITEAVAAALTPGEQAQWLTLYAQRFRAVPGASSLGTTEDAYFIFDGALRIGLGQIRGGELRSVAALEQGRGADCVCALAAQSGAQTIDVLCARENLPAMRLYDRLGFSAGTETERWYCRK